MRCFGLTGERRRCAAQAASETNYCDHHRGPFAEAHRRQQSARGGSGRRLVQLLRPGPAPYVVPDDCKFSIPSWLRKSGTDAVVDHLLHNTNMLTRWLAAYTLRKRRDPLTIEPLWQVLQLDPASLVRQQAAVALGKIGTNAVQGPLIEALWHDMDAGVRQACAIALGNLGFPLATQHLVAALRREPAVFVRWDCALALGQVGDREIESLLAELATKEPSPVVRRACNQAIDEIRNRE